MAVQAWTAVRQFLAVPSKLWLDMLAALRIAPVAIAIDRGVDLVVDRIDRIDRIAVNAIDRIDRIATTFFWVFGLSVGLPFCLFAALRVWEVCRRA
ncbi:hypothetical protein KFE25_007275 [Diacronema lutheri]|uniref:Uncharacterized protein n=1 Tax=Diacronema lutheri TaxID=2081491 RepID=A0A8J6C486_DIALT|nr:hypothetical protein KFE25_007275 [Diacronema lutheri]